MNDRELAFTPATELVALIRDRKLSPVELTKSLLDRIDSLNPQLNAYCTVCHDEALRDARASERLIYEGAQTKPLHGVPVSIKDLVATRGVRTTWGSKIFENYVPDYDAPLVERLKAAGAIVIGKTNTPEFGHLGVTHNRVFGATRNPWNPERTPGGSSGGAGAAVAAGLAPLAIGTDGGGSIRIPAAFTGVFGLKPNLGRIPSFPQGVGMELLSHAGPMTRTVADAALMLDVLAGPDDRDINSLPKYQGSFLDAARAHEVKGLKVAWSLTLGYAVVSREVAGIVERAVGTLRRVGCSVEPVDKVFDDPADAWRVLFSSTYAAARRDDLEKVRDQLEPTFVEFIAEALNKTAVDFVRAGAVRRSLTQRMGELLGRFDVLVTPTMPLAAFPLGINNPTEIDGVSLGLMGWNPFNYPFNMTGQPAASVPCGFTQDGLPVGLQIVGRRFDEATVLRVSAAIEAAAPWADKRPPAPFG